MTVPIDPQHGRCTVNVIISDVGSRLRISIEDIVFAHKLTLNLYIGCGAGVFLLCNPSDSG